MNHINPDELIKFNKTLVLNDHSFQIICELMERLLWCMRDTNKQNNMTTQYFRFNLVDSLEYMNAKELRLEWESVKNDT